MKQNSKQILLQRYDKFFGNSASQKLLRFQNELKNNQFIRINLSKTTTKEIEQFLKKNRVKYSKTFLPNALKIGRSFFNLSSSIEALTGKIYIQDLASQVPINLINFNKLKTKKQPIQILDMAASPGSKTTQLTDLLNHHKINYKITALEPQKIRLNRLINNIQKQQLTNIKIIQSTGENFKSNTKFDLIILDAPCSGNLIDDKKWLEKRNIEGIQKSAKLQKGLLTNATKLLAKNGTIIYSTCSLEPEENEHIIDFAQKKLNLKSKKTNLNFGFETTPAIKNQNSIRLMPYKSKTQGFFVCILEK